MPILESKIESIDVATKAPMFAASKIDNLDIAEDVAKTSDALKRWTEIPTDQDELDRAAEVVKMSMQYGPQNCPPAYMIAQSNGLGLALVEALIAEYFAMAGGVK